MSQKEVVEVFVKNSLTKILGYESGIRVRFTERIKDQGNVSELGISQHYIFCAMKGRGSKTTTFYSSTNSHDFLKGAIVETTGCNPEELRLGQISMEGEKGNRRFYSIVLHDPLSKGRLARQAELRNLVGGISPLLWRERVFVSCPEKTEAIYRPLDGTFELMK